MSQRLEAPSKDSQSQPLPTKVPGKDGRRPCLGSSGQTFRSTAPTKYPARMAGVPDALIFFCFFSCIKARKGPLPRAGKFAGYTKAIRKSPKLAGIPDALIFFCFFSCIKARKEGLQSRQEEKAVNASQRDTSPYPYPPVQRQSAPPAHPVRNAVDRAPPAREQTPALG